MPKWYLLFPLTAAVMYAFAALSLKQAERGGVRAVRITVLSNFALALAFAPFWVLEYPNLLPATWWPVLAAGATFAVGQFLTILAFAKGEVSIATPALGTKAIFVAIVAAAFTAKQVGPHTWGAAALMVAGLWLLVGRPHHADRKRVIFAVVCSLTAAFAYACFDVIVGAWSERLRFGLLVPPAVLVGSLLSLPLLGLPGPRRAWDPEAAPPWRRWGQSLLAGVVLMSVQSLLLLWSIGTFHDAPGANVVYASRGVWSVLLVQGVAAAAAGGGAAAFASGGEFLRRLCGAGVMLVGVVLAFLGKS